MPALLPYGRQTIDDDDVTAVAQALRSDWLTTGPRVEEFEMAFATATGAIHAVACNSGTAALHLAALALGLGPGDLAIVPTMTFLATANVVRMTGAEVVFADVDSETGLLTSETFEEAIARAKGVAGKLRAGFPVHLNGQLCDMKALADISARREIVLIEDACHSLGVTDIGACQHSAVACFSTHAVKAIATGEGGVTTTRAPPLAETMRVLRNHGMVRDPAQFTDVTHGTQHGAANPWYYEMATFGWNYRMPDVLCALGISQLRKLLRFQARRREIAALYNKLLSPLAPTIRPVPHGQAPHGWHLYTVLIDFASLGASRRQVMQALRTKGIGSQVHYIPVHSQPYYRNRYGHIDLTGAEAYYARCLSLPFYPSLSDSDVERVAGALASLLTLKSN
jgi:UDP-4-amino-4,6-dideoxy-N-acetyl-beta-L-altrosamine transaminase